VGHSWGSIIGLLAAERRPDLYAVYIGVGQQVDFVENDIIGYEMALEAAKAAGDEQTVSKLRENGPPPYTAEEGRKYMYLFQRVFRYSPEAPDAPHINEMSIFTPEEYFQLLEAPVKRHYWFEKSGHEACFQQPEKFRRILLEEVVPLSRAAVR
jgi:pimeloyl-ACP methyl ester carboxylesterase